MDEVVKQAFRGEIQEVVDSETLSGDVVYNELCQMFIEKTTTRSPFFSFITETQTPNIIVTLSYNAILDLKSADFVADTDTKDMLLRLHHIAETYNCAAISKFKLSTNDGAMVLEVSAKGLVHMTLVRSINSFTSVANVQETMARNQVSNSRLAGLLGKLGAISSFALNSYFNTERRREYVFAGKIKAPQNDLVTQRLQAFTNQEILKDLNAMYRNNIEQVSLETEQASSGKHRLIKNGENWLFLPFDIYTTLNSLQRTSKNN